MLSTRFPALFVLLALPLAAQQAAPAADAKQRARAARELAKQGSSAIPQLQAMLADADRDVRIEAVKAIVDIDTQFSLDPLVQATRDNDPEVQIRATDGLVNFYLPGYVRAGLSASLRRVGTAIKTKFTDTNDAIIPPYVEVRPGVIDALGKIASGGASMEARANAARALGILRGKTALPSLYDALRSKDDRLMYESLVAIEKIRDPASGPRIEYLLRDLNEKIQIEAIAATGLLLNRGALPQLASVLNNSRNARVRRAALGAIAMMPDETNRSLFMRYLNDKDEGLRAAAAEGLGRLKNTSDLPLLEKAFNDEQKMSPRLSDAFAVVMLGKTDVSEFSALQYLINALNSSAWKGVARPFLVELARDAQVRLALQAATSKGSRDEKIELAYVLSVSGDKGSLPSLDALTRDSDSAVVEAALNAVRTLKSRLP